MPRLVPVLHQKILIQDLGRSFGNPIAIFFLKLTGADIGLCTFIAVQYSPGVWQ